MFRRSEVARLLDERIAAQVRHLSDPDITVQGYAQTFDDIVRLTELRKTERSAPLSKDVLATVGANLLGIVMIIKYEQVNAITSKALGFVAKLRF